MQLVGQAFAVAHQPGMAGKQVHLVAGPVSVVRHGLRVSRNGAPEVGDHAVEVVDGFDPLALRRPQQHGGRAGKRLHIVVHKPEGGPHLLAGIGFATEPWERGGEGSCNAFHAGTTLMLMGKACTADTVKLVVRPAWRSAP